MEQDVSTEAQRKALEAMSADLVRKLNIMIQQQDARVRAFAAEHHSTMPPAPQAPLLHEPAAEHTSAPAGTTPPPPTRPLWEQQRPPARRTPTPPPARKEAPPQEESNIGLGMVIFALVGIMILIRSCT